MGKATGKRVKQQDLALRAINDNWARRHPQLARAERAIRIENAQAKRNFGHKRNGTPETHAKASKTRQGALARLFEAGDIDQMQLASAVSIAITHARITGDVTIATMSLETRVDHGRSADGTFFEKLGAVRAEVTYSRWRLAIAHPAVVLAMVVDDIGVTAAAKQFGMRNVTAKKLLTDALDLWDSMNIEACKEIDAATLAAAQAGIL